MANLDTWLPLLRSPGGSYRLQRTNGDLTDESGIRYPVTDGIPRLLAAEELGGDDARWSRFYNWFAPVYTWNERVGTRLLCGVNLRAEQRRMVAELGIAPGSRVLEVSPGPAVFQRWLAQAVGADGALAAVDLSWGMIRQCVAGTRRQIPAPFICQGNGAALPFADGVFDAVFHFGGIKLFSQPRQAMDEFARVVRVGGSVFVGDEGYAPDLPDSRRLRLIARMNTGFGREAPTPPPQLAMTAQSMVYGGYGFLWSMRRVDAPASNRQE